MKPTYGNLQKGAVPMTKFIADTTRIVLTLLLSRAPRDIVPHARERSAL